MTFQNYSKMQMLACSVIGLGIYFTLWIFPLNLIVVHLLTRVYARPGELTMELFLENLKIETIMFLKTCVSISIKCAKKVKEYMAKDEKTSCNETDADEEPSNNDINTNENSNSNANDSVEDVNDSDESSDAQQNNVEEKAPEQIIDSGEEEDDENED